MVKKDREWIRRRGIKGIRCERSAVVTCFSPLIPATRISNKPPHADVLVRRFWVSFPFYFLLSTRPLRHFQRPRLACLFVSKRTSKHKKVSLADRPKQTTCSDTIYLYPKFGSCLDRPGHTARVHTSSPDTYYPTYHCNIFILFYFSFFSSHLLKTQLSQRSRGNRWCPCAALATGIPL
jgi:hypothetical protein